MSFEIKIKPKDCFNCQFNHETDDLDFYCRLYNIKWDPYEKDDNNPDFCKAVLVKVEEQDG